MIEVLWMVAQLSVAFVGGLLACGMIVAGGGLGALRDLRKAHDSLEDEVGRLGTRLSRDQKTRAGEKGIEARAEARTLTEQAHQHLATPASKNVVRMPGRAKSRAH